MAIQFNQHKFNDNVEENLQNDFMRGAVASAQNHLYTKRLDAVEELGDWEEWRNHAQEIRQHVLENLDYYLHELAINVEKAGGHIHFARDADDANAYIREIVRQKNAKKIVKSKSMVTEEISLNEALEAEGCQVLETDLGEYILQLEGDKPSHIVAPSLHKNKDQIKEVFVEKLGYDPQKTSEAGELARYVRDILREEFLAADLGVTGCNFAVADSGSICLVTNEGNGGLVTTIPKTHIAVMGMERLVPSMEELDVLVSMLTRSAVGQKLSSYVNIVTGPKHRDEVDGPEEFHLVVLDNGRSSILGGDFEEVLQCIRCGACVNTCPVYRHIGGHSYNSIYSGPIGAVLTPLLAGYDDYKELPYASSLCGACTDVCPVKIPLHELLLKHRQVIVEEEGRAPVAEGAMMKLFEFGASRSPLYRLGTKVAATAIRPFAKDDMISKGPGPLKAWTDIRDFPAPKRESLRDWFDKRDKGGKA